MANKNVYALFVGVDLYDIKSGISPLSGCVNDAKRMLDYLDKNIDREQYNFDKNLHAVTLFSERGNTDKSMYPTRDNILKYFKEHLIANVKKDDYAIFFYAGHGTTEPAHPYFNEPTNKVQALVPYDARTPAKNQKGERIKVNGKDVQVRCILDKEIRFLIRKLWETSGSENIIFIQDSCHSAGASRAEDAVGAIVSAINDAKKQGVEGIETFAEKTRNTSKSKQPAKNRTDHGSSYPSELLEQLSDSEKNVLRIYKNGPPKGSDLANKIEKLLAQYNNKEEDSQEDEEAFSEEHAKSIPINAAPAPRFLSPEGAENISWANKNPIAEIEASFTAFQLFNDEHEDKKSRSLNGNSNDRKVQEPFDIAFPQGNHIHLAACSSAQYAYEIKHTDDKGNQYRGGVFTNTLLSLLKMSKNNISYHDLFNRAKLSIDGVFKQTPDIYIKGGNIKKQYDYFLGDTIKREEIKDFKGSYSAVYNEKEGWKINAGEHHGLPRTEGNVNFIPAYVYEQGEHDNELDLDKQEPNAYLRPVLAQESFLYADGNKLDADGNPRLVLDPKKFYNVYISPKWHRRRRVRVAIQDSKIEYNFAEHLQQHKYKQHIQLVDELAAAEYSIKPVEGKCLVYKVIGGAEQLFCTVNTFFGTMGGSVQFEETAVKGVYAEDNKEEWSFKNKVFLPSNCIWDFEAGYHFNTSHYIIDLILPKDKEGKIGVDANTKINIKVYPVEKENPFRGFMARNQDKLSYYNNFVNWTEPTEENKTKIDYYIAHDGAHYFLTADNTFPAIPAFRQTKDLSDSSALELIAQLQKMTQWYTLSGFKNKVQNKIFDDRTLNLKLTIYKDENSIKLADKLEIDIDLLSGTYCIVGEQERKPLFSKETKGIQHKDIFYLQPFVRDPNMPEEKKPNSRFRYGLVFTNKEREDSNTPADVDQKLYVSMLEMNEDFAISTLQQQYGCEAVPLRPKSATDSLGQITISSMDFWMPKTMKRNPEIKESRMILKIFVGFASFDISKYLQEALKPAISLTPQGSAILDAKSAETGAENRSVVNIRPQSKDPGGWAAFHIPIIINRDAPILDTSSGNGQPNGLEEEEDFDF